MAEGDELVRAHVLVSGRVQGVYFRAATRQRAESLGLSGWVRNLPDGRVEAAFQGPAAEVGRALAWVREGPPGASVTAAEVEWETPQAEAGFALRH